MKDGLPMMRHHVLRSVHVFGKVLSIIFSDVLSDKMAEKGMMNLRSVHVFGKVLSMYIFRCAQ